MKRFKTISFIFLGIITIFSFLGCPGGGRTVLECSADFLCPSGMFCELGEKCGGIDRKGLCRPQPQNCSVEDDYVCGCDGRDYPNACLTNASGMTVAYPGKCMRSMPKQ